MVTDSVIDNEQTISELVSQAVHKVLSGETGELTSEKSPSDDTKDSHSSDSETITYNPTPISQLNKYKNGSKNISKIVSDGKKIKRHIPILYTPQRPQQSFQRPQYGTAGTSKDSDPWTGSYVPSSIKSLQADNVESTSNSYTPNPSSSNDNEPSYNPSSKSSQSSEAMASHTYNPSETSKNPVSVSYSPTVITGEKTELSTSMVYSPISDEKPELSSVTYNPTLISKTQETALSNASSNTDKNNYNPTAIKNTSENEINSVYVPNWLSDEKSKESSNDGDVDFLDEFLNDPNLYEVEEEKNDKNCDIKLSKSSDSSKKHSKHRDSKSDHKRDKNKTDRPKSNEHKSSDHKKHRSDSKHKPKENGIKSKSSDKHQKDDKNIKTDKKHSDSRSSSRSKSTDKKQDKSKDSDKSDVKSEKTSSHKSEKSKDSSKSRHSSRDHKKPSSNRSCSESTSNRLSSKSSSKSSSSLLKSSSKSSTKSTQNLPVRNPSSKLENSKSSVENNIKSSAVQTRTLMGM